MNTLESSIEYNGLNQSDLVKFLENVRDTVNQLRAQSLYRPLGNPTFAIDTNFDVKTTVAISYVNGGTLKTLAANTSFNTGTTKTITAAKWAAALLSVNSSGTAVLTWTTGDAYDSEALAIAALAAPAATDTVLGYVTVLAGASTWTAGTSALQSGTGGTPATTTNYYNSVNPSNLLVTDTALTLQKG